MIKLSEFEKQYLTELQREGYNYIARDKDGRMFAYIQEPFQDLDLVEYEWLSREGDWLELGILFDYFEFVKWSDEKATSIDDLLVEQEEPKVTPIAEIKVNFSEDDIKNLIEKTLLQNDYAPVIHAHWVWKKTPLNKESPFCSNCNTTSLYTTGYCSCCGAKMDEVIDDD